MSFVVLLLAILIEKFSALRQRLQRDSGWVRELHKLEASTRLANRPWWVLAILVLLPVMLLGLLLVVLDPVAYGLLALPVHADQLHSEFLFEEPFLLAVPENHALAQRDSLSLRELSDQTGG